MNFEKYDSIQAQLGAVGDNFKNRAKFALEISGGDPDSKVLVERIVIEVEESLNDICRLISNAMQASIE